MNTMKEIKTEKSEPETRVEVTKQCPICDFIAKGIGQGGTE